MKPIIAPSVLSADFANLRADIEMINNSAADWFHVDVMDGMFVPNISFGFPVMSALQKYAAKPLDVHLMIVDPDRYIQAFADAGAEVITVHYEACTHLHRTVQAIRAAGCRPGIAVNPHTNVQLLEDILGDVDLVLIMSVNPGFGGQQFIERTYEKVSALKTMANHLRPDLIIEVDGGVGLQNIATLMAAGANAFVAGNAVFSAPDPAEIINTLKQTDPMVKAI